MSTFPGGHTIYPDINSWNEAAEAELRSEIQALAAGMASPREGISPNRGVGEFSIMATHHCHSLPVTPSPIRMVGPRMLRTVCFLITSTVIRDLPNILNAPSHERMVMLALVVGKAVAAAAAAGLAAKALDTLKRNLLRNLESCCKSPIVKSIGGTAMVAVPMVAVYNAFRSLWDYVVGSFFASSPEVAQARKEAAAAYWSRDELVRAGATSVAGIACIVFGSVVATCPAVLGVLEALLFYALDGLVDVIIEQKNERGGWMPWLRMWIMPEELRAWSSDDFDAVEMTITEDLICPISRNLVVDPVVGPFLPRTQPHVYERDWLYKWLKKEGKDPLTNISVTALDYKRSHVAAALATQIAHHYGATLQPL